MALVINDRVKETTTTTGTGAVSLAGAVTGFEAFSAGVGNSNTTYYAIVHQTEDEFEVGLGTLDGDSSDLTRTTVISSSNSDSAVDFAAGTKDVFCTIPASKLVFEDASNDVTVGNDFILGSDSAVLKFGADSDTTLTHTDGTGLTLNSTNKLLFRDTGLYINSSTDGQLDIVADTEIQIAATTIDINGAVALNGAITGATNITLTGELDAATLDISGNADIDGTLEADAITINGVTLAETISDTVGAMVTSNTESGITVAYDDADNTLDFTVGTLNQDTTGSAATLTTARNIGGTSFDGSANIAVALASVGTAVTVADESSDTTCFPLFATAATGDLGPKSGSNLTFNSSSGLLTATSLAGTVSTATQNSITTMTGLVTTGALGTGTIAAGFGNIDNGASSITNGGLVKLDVDADADDVTGDSATGRLTIGDGEDLNLYHGGTNSYVVNDTGILVLQSAGGIVVNENSANVDFRVESNGDANMLIVDGSSNRVGMGVAAPEAPLHVFQAGSNSSTTELLLLETGSSSDASGVKLRMATAHTSGIIEMVDGTGSFDSEFRFKLADTSQLATPADKLILTTKNAEFKTGAYNAEVALTDGSTVAWNASTAPIAKVTLGGNRTLGAATVPQTGQFISILFIQDGTGSRTITFNAAYEHTGDIAPVLTTTANKGDLFVYRYNGAKFLEVGRNLNLTLS